MKYILIIALLSLSETVMSADADLIQGNWSAQTTMYRDIKFTIRDKKISFPNNQCNNISFEIIERSDADIVNDRGRIDHFDTFILKLDIPDTKKCVDVRGRSKYIRMSVYKLDRCYSATSFYKTKARLDADKANQWGGHYDFGNQEYDRLRDGCVSN